MFFIVCVLLCRLVLWFVVIGNSWLILILNGGSGCFLCLYAIDGGSHGVAVDEVGGGMA